MDRRKFIGGSMTAVAAAGVGRPAWSGEYDLVVKDVRAFIGGSFVRKDLGIAGDRIVKIAEPGTLAADETIAQEGLYASPGWVDLHVHYVDLLHRKTAGSSIEQLGLGEGVTALVDVGTTGAANYGWLEGSVADAPSPGPECYALLNICREGIKLTDFYLTRPGMEDLKAMERVLADNPRIRGFKYRADNTVSPPKDRLYYVRKIREAGDAFGLPAMVHIGGPPPSLVDILPYMKEGDLITHFLRPVNNSAVDESGQVRPEVVAALDRGVKFDLGHGMASYSFFAAERAFDQGFLDFTISSDLYIMSRPLFARTFANVLTNVLAAGMPLEDVIERASARPAKFLGLDREIREGGEATLTLFSMEEGDFTCTDVKREKRKVGRRVIPWWTVMKGRAVRAGARDRKLFL